MIERIKELALQATSYVDTLDVADQKIYQEIRDREFAELIVKECASVCYNSELQDSDLHAQNLLYEFNINNCRNEK
jgi:hypothetical protein